jgi:hypothetical protein
MLLEHRSLRAITSVGDIFSNTCILSSMRWQLSLATVVVQSKAVDRCMRLLVDLVAFLRPPIMCAELFAELHTTSYPDLHSTSQRMIIYADHI